MYDVTTDSLVLGSVIILSLFLLQKKLIQLSGVNLL